jgi:2-polyprenyl-3-methyl-5-hydroxy-6-metoxy-1,4-benzoquinol methylase
MSDVNPSKIMQVGMGFWASKTLLSAVELGVFTTLARQPMTGGQLEQKLELHARGTYDFLDALVALGFLNRDGDGKGGLYRNTDETQIFLDRESPRYIGGMLEMANERLYGYWGDLTEALRTGKPQNEVKHVGKPVFEALYADPAGLEGFMNAMTGISMGNFNAFAQKFDFSKYKTMCDVGGATGQLSVLVARHNAHMQLTTFDLPPVEPIAQKTIDETDMGDRVSTASGDFFEDPLPKADVITMGMILHDWNLEKKKHLIRAAYEALPPGGAFCAIENIIDDARRENAFGLMMSLNMLIEFGEAFDFTGADFTGWCKEAGFERTEVMHLAGPCSVAVAYK